MEVRSTAQLITGVGQNMPTGNQAIPGIPGAPNNPVTPGENPASVFTPAEPAVTYESDMNRVREMWNSHQTQVDSFRRMIETLIGQQAEKQGLASGFSLRNVEVTDEMRTEAKEMIDEGGYFSVEETATRILDFAVALTGGDPGRIDLMRGAVERGFTQAERMFGGELPKISHQTREAVMNGFDEWAEAGNANAISLLKRE